MMIFLAIVSFLIYFPVHGTGDGLNIDGSSHTPNRESSFARKKWISEIIADVEMRFDMNINVSDECRRDFKIYRLHAENQTVWAIRMMESSEWPRIGLFSGATTHLGHYSECLRSRGPSIKGQYCIVQATFNFTDNFSGQPVPGYTGWPEENASAWNVIKEYEKNPFRRSRRLLVWAMCIPSSCTAADLQTSLNNSLHPVFQAQELTISAYVNPVLCTVEDASTPPSYHTTGVESVLGVNRIRRITFVRDFSFWTCALILFSDLCSCKLTLEHSS